MNWRLIWRGLKKPSMRNKVLAVFGILLVYRILAHVPLPLSDPASLKQILDNLLNSEGTPQLLSFINVLSGGALASFSIMLVGLGPYINASIVMQVLTKAIPKLEAMQKEGEYGRRKINQYTRLLTLPLAMIQSVLALYFVRQIATQLEGAGDVFQGIGLGEWVLMIVTLTAGAMILMWLGELITEHKIGNGISLIITVGIISQLPRMIGDIWRAITDVEMAQSFSIFGWFDLPINGYALRYAGLLILAIILVTIFVVYINEAQRRIKISYAKKVQGNRLYSNVSTHLPIKLVAAGVVPIIFAVAFLSMPQLIGQIFLGEDSWLVRWFTAPGTGGDGVTTGTAIFADPVSLIYPAVYFGLVVAFTYFYTNVVFSAKDISESLQRQGGFIEGRRPGLETQKYLSQVVNRLNLFGSVSLGFLALTPILAQAFLRTNQLAIGGTSILILVAVALETLRQIESKALVVTYEDQDPAAQVGQSGLGRKRQRRWRRPGPPVR